MDLGHPRGPFGGGQTLVGNHDGIRLDLSETSADVDPVDVGFDRDLLMAADRAHAGLADRGLDVLLDLPPVGLATDPVPDLHPNSQGAGSDGGGDLPRRLFGRRQGFLAPAAALPTQTQIEADR